MIIEIRREKGELSISFRGFSEASIANTHQQALEFGEAAGINSDGVLIRDENNFVAWFAQILRKNINEFTYLRINNYLMDSDKCKLIGEALSQNTVVKRLELYNFAAHGADITPIVNSIANSTSLEILNLDLERSQTTEWKLLGEALTHQKSIKELVIDTDDEEREKYYDTFSFVARILKHNTTINSLCLSNLDWSQEVFNCFCEHLTANTTLTNLTWNNKVNSLVLDPLCKYLRTTKSLKGLNLFLSRQHEQEIDKLGQALSVNTSLTTLCLESGTTPKQFFSHVIKLNSNIRALTAKNIEIDDLLEVIKTTTSLTKLLVYSWEIRLGVVGTNIGQSETIKQALENNYSLRSAQFNGKSELSKTVCQRNTELHKQWYEETALSIHVMARSHLFSRLPAELWIAMFNKIRYPGLESFEPLAKSILKMYQPK